MDTSMKKLLFALLFLASPAYAQTQTQYYTVPTIAALKAMTTSRATPQRAHRAGD